MPSDASRQEFYRQLIQRQREEQEAMDRSGYSNDRLNQANAAHVSASNYFIAEGSKRAMQLRGEISTFLRNAVGAASVSGGGGMGSEDIYCDLDGWSFHIQIHAPRRL